MITPSKGRPMTAGNELPPIERIERDHPGVIEAIRTAVEWSEFARSLYIQLVRQNKPWSPKQLQAAINMKAKLDEKAKRDAAPKPKIDLSAVLGMFRQAQAAGLQRPTYRAEGLHLSLAPVSGRNAGCIYVKDVHTSEYLGKITPEGVAHFARSGHSPEFDAEARLNKIAENPLEAALRYGKEFGICSCCGRTLTNLASIELGIGPICRGKWGL